VKLLDFGLAKMTAEEAIGSVTHSHLPWPGVDGHSATGDLGHRRAYEP
jgi:hypothetical protein